MPDFKLTLQMTMSINGMIAERDGQVPWTEPIWEEFFKFVRQNGALIVGRKTYDLMQGDELAKLDGVQIAVLSNSLTATDDTIVHSEPSQIIKSLKVRGIEQAVLGGGTATNSLFMAQGLVDELALDIYPLIMRAGMPLFEGLPVPVPATLLRTENLGGNCLRVHYKL